MYTVYVIQSESHGRYYIGHTKDLLLRLKKHNSSGVKSTRYGKPWKIIYTEKYDNKPQAFRREMEIKKYKGGFQFKQLLK